MISQGQIWVDITTNLIYPNKLFRKSCPLIEEHHYIVFIHTITMAILNKSAHTNMPRLISLSLSSPAGKVTPYIENIQER